MVERDEHNRMAIAVVVGTCIMRLGETYGVVLS